MRSFSPTSPRPMWTSSQAQLRRLDADWHQPAPRVHNFPLIARYYAATQSQPAYHRLPDQAWDDLNGEPLFALLDATVSRVGQQCLYQRLRSPLADAPALEAFDAAATLLAQDAAGRGQALLALHHLSSTQAYYLTDLLAGEALPPLPGAQAAPWLVLALLLTLVGGYWLPALWLGSLALMLSNSVLHFWHRSRVVFGVRPLLQVGNLHRVGRALAKLSLPLGPLQELTAPVAQIGGLVGNLAFLQAEGPQQSDMAALPWLFIEYLKMVFLLDLFIYRRCQNAVQQHNGAIRTVFEAVGYVDCVLAVASFRQRHAHCVPQFAPTDAGLHLAAGYNPLVPGCVPNDLTIKEGVLLTGSNMAGKTTFMRTIGLNALLAQTIATCPAAAYRAPFCQVLTTLNLADSLPEGKSYYLAEAQAVHALLQATEAAPGSYLLLLDELFKGTNTQERIAATHAVLSYLQPRSLVVASTHDGELGELLGETFREYHFCETVTEEDWYFDYRLKAGPLTTRNAIRLLARVGYPAEVVAAAQALSATLSKKGAPA